MNVPLSVVIAIIGPIVALVGTLIILNLRSIKSCVRSWTQQVDKQDQQLDQTGKEVRTLGIEMRDCKVDCERSFVSAELFLRETGYTRRSMETLTASVSRIEGKLTVVEKLPQICGDISREIVKEMRNGAANGT